MKEKLMFSNRSKLPTLPLLACLLSTGLTALVTAPADAQAPTIRMPLQPISLPAEKDLAWRRIGPQLTALHELYRAHRVNRPSQPFDPGLSFLSIHDDSVVIDAAADGDIGQLEAALDKLGATDIVTFRNVVSARLPLAAIPKLADIEWLRFARPSAAFTNVGNTDSQGDAAMNTDDARTAFGVDGSGVTVGVLSDSLDCGAGTPGSYATDVDTGDLPSGIEVLEDDPCGRDEGRAMLQLIFDVAPGADLSFHAASGGMARFALGIQELAGCPPGSEPGCTAAVDPAEVLVDDWFYFAAPMFQDDIIAQAVDVVHEAGVSYFSAAGNHARASWEGGPFVPSGISPPGYGPGGDAHDFDPGPGVDIYQLVSFPAGLTSVSFQWDEPHFSVSGAPGSASDMDICVYPESPEEPLLGCVSTANAGGDPVEFFTLPLEAPTALNFTIVKYVPDGGPDPGPDPGLMKYVALNSGFSVTDSYPTVQASASFGHRNASGSIGVGAAWYAETPEFGQDPPLLEPSSSAGGTPILFDTAGNRLAEKEIRMRPQVTAPDGTNTTFFGADDSPGTGCCEQDGFPNFFGTSAAAPHAAAVSALMLEASPGLTPSGVEDVLISSADDMMAPGFDHDSGYGLIDGNAAVGSVHSETAACDGVADLMLDGLPNSGPAVFSATNSISWGDGTFNDVTGLAPEHIFTDGFESGDTASWGTSCP